MLKAEQFRARELINWDGDVVVAAQYNSFRCDSMPPQYHYDDGRSQLVPLTPLALMLSEYCKCIAEHALLPMFISLS